MKSAFYRIKCLTNMHMGSGDQAFEVIDLAVEKDPVTGEPTMNASGVKGALRDACTGLAAKEIEDAFGSDKNGDIPGTYRFFSGDLIARPVRVSEGARAYVLATSSDIMEVVVKKLDAFGVWEQLFPDCGADGFIEFLKKQEGIATCLKKEEAGRIEGDAVKTRIVPDGSKPEFTEVLNTLIGSENWVIMPESTLSQIDLPVFAHNVLDEKGISENLWYEQVVPHESVFGLIIGMPDKDEQSNIIDEMLLRSNVVQFGGNASTGEGFTRLEKLQPKAEQREEAQKQ